MTFADTYGAFAENYIHVHHIEPFNEIEREYEVDPIKDLRPLCPNCHAAIHLTNPLMTPEQFKEMLDSQKELI